MGGSYLGSRNLYQMTGAFYKIFHLLPHARLTHLHWQLPSCLLQIMGISAMQERTQISPPPLTQHKHFKGFSSKCHTGMWMVLQVSVANVQNEQVASVAPLWKLLFKLHLSFQGSLFKKKENFGVIKSVVPWELEKKTFCFIWVLESDWTSHFVHVESLHNNCILAFGAHLPPKGKFCLLLSTYREVYKSASTQTWELRTWLPFQETLIAQTITASALFRNTGRGERSYDKFSFPLKLITSYKGFW